MERIRRESALRNSTEFDGLKKFRSIPPKETMDGPVVRSCGPGPGGTHSGRRPMGENGKIASFNAHHAAPFLSFSQRKGRGVKSERGFGGCVKGRKRGGKGMEKGRKIRGLGDETGGPGRDREDRKVRKRAGWLGMPAGRMDGIAIFGAFFTAQPRTYISIVLGKHGSDCIQTSRSRPCDRPLPASPYHPSRLDARGAGLHRMYTPTSIG